MFSLFFEDLVKKGLDTHQGYRRDEALTSNIDFASPSASFDIGSSCN